MARTLTIHAFEVLTCLHVTVRVDEESDLAEGARRSVYTVHFDIPGADELEEGRDVVWALAEELLGLFHREGPAPARV